MKIQLKTKRVSAAVIFALGSVATMQSAGAAEIFLGTEGQNTEVTITNQYEQNSQVFGRVNATQAEAQGSPGVYKTAGNVALVIGSLTGGINLDDIIGGGYAKGATVTSTVGDVKIMSMPAPITSSVAGI